MPYVRSVKWLHEIERDALSIRTKNSLGSTLTLFRVPDFAAKEVLDTCNGRAPAQTTAAIDTSIAEEPTEAAELYADAESRATEFIKDRISRLDWEDMQELIAGILRAMGYKTRISKVGPDRGIDIVASPDALGLQTPRIFVEVKHRGGQMGSKDIRSFLSVRRHQGDRGLYVSTGGFSREARYEADRAEFPVTLWELDDVVRASIDSYDEVDTEAERLTTMPIPGVQSRTAARSKLSGQHCCAAAHISQYQ